MSRAAPLLRRGVELFNAGRPLEAADAFGRAAKNGGGDAAACLLGRSLHAAGRSHRALSVLRASSARRPGSAQLHLALAEVLRDLGDAEGAYAAFARAAALPGGAAAQPAMRKLAVERARAARGPQAERWWREAWRLSPGDPEARAELVTCLRRRGCWEEVVALDPDDAEARRRLALSLKARAAREAGKRAERLLERAEAVDPGQADALRRERARLLRARAASAERAGRRRQAGKLRDRADRLDPPDPRARAERFKVLVREARYQEAFAEGEKILDRGASLWDLRAFWAPWDVARLEGDRARHIEAVRGLAGPWAAYYRGFLLGGAAGLEEFRRLDAEDGRRYGWMQARAGQSFLYAGDLAEAARRLRRALGWKTSDWRWRGFLAEALLFLGEPAKSSAQIARAEREAPAEERGHALAWRAALELWKGRYARAQAAAAKAQELRAPYAGCWLGAAKLLRGDAGGALAALNEALTLDPRDAEARVFRAEALVRQRRWAEALAELDKRGPGLWAGVVRCLAFAAKGDEAALRRAFEALPADFRVRASRAAGWDLAEPAPPARRLVAALEAGLRLAKGWRRDEEHGRALWAGQARLAAPRDRAQRFRELVRAGRYEAAFEEGERLLDAGPTLHDLRAFWSPWKTERLEKDRSEHFALVDAAARRRPSAWTDFYRGILRGFWADGEDFAALESRDQRRYGWMWGRAGHCALQGGRLDRAAAWLARGGAARPRDWRVRGFLAEARLCRGEEDLAMAEIARARREAPEEELGQALAWEAGLELWRGRYARAYAAADRACSLGAPYAHCWRGAAKLMLGDAPGALRLLDAALALFPDDNEAGVWRAETLRRLSRPREALAELERRPRGLWSGVNRALCLAAIGDDQGLVREYLRLPADFRLHAQRASGWDLLQPITARRAAAALEAGLRRARGWRRDEEHGKGLWAR